MPSFILKDAPGAYRYRPLKKNDNGWDVYALQTGLRYIGYSLGIYGADGYFGVATHNAVMNFQNERKLLVDGIVGITTQTAIVRAIAPAVTATKQLPKNALKGQIEKESGNILGNHSATYSDGSIDLGVTQRNSRYHSYEDSFDVAESIVYLGNQIRDRYNAYKDPSCVARLAERGLPATSTQRKWELAMGSWNRPAWANYLAGRPMGESAKPSASDIQWLEGYIDRVTSYVTVWPTT